MADHQYTDEHHLPTLKREGWDDFSMADADVDINAILTDLEQRAATQEQASDVERLSEILGGLMAYCAAMHADLMMYRKLMN